MPTFPVHLVDPLDPVDHVNKSRLAWFQNDFQWFWHIFPDNDVLNSITPTTNKLFFKHGMLNPSGIDLFSGTTSACGDIHSTQHLWKHILDDSRWTHVFFWNMWKTELFTLLNGCVRTFHQVFCSVCWQICIYVYIYYEMKKKVILFAFVCGVIVEFVGFFQIVSHVEICLV